MLRPVRIAVSDLHRRRSDRSRGSVARRSQHGAPTLLLVVSLTGCSLVGTNSTPNASEHSRESSATVGVIVEMDLESERIVGFVLELESDERIKVVLLEGQDYGFDLHHLKEHARTLEPVTVIGPSREGHLVAHRILDAPR